VLTAALLLGYWLAMMLISVPGHGAGDLSPAGNLASFVDRRLFTGHLWRPGWDPEGVLSTLPAIASTLLGTLAAGWIRYARHRTTVAAGMLAAGAGGMVVGEIWSWWFPINKTLWTSSYAVFTAGFALVALGACYWLMDVKQWRGWAKPFVAFGTNPLALFVGSEVLGYLLYIGRWPETQASIKHALFRMVFLGWAAPVNGSLLWALAYVAGWWAVAWLMYRRAIFIKL
jgi:predicted acyltransferase